LQWRRWRTSIWSRIKIDKYRCGQLALRARHSGLHYTDWIAFEKIILHRRGILVVNISTVHLGEYASVIDSYV
jgi:hypothetical protein